MKLIRRLIVTTRTRRWIQVLDPARGTCPVCGAEIGAASRAETPDSRIEDGKDFSPIADGRVPKIFGVKELGEGKKE